MKKIWGVRRHANGVTWRPIVQTNQRSIFFHLTNENKAKKTFEGVVHPIVPEGCDQSRAIRGVCGGGTHHPVRRLPSVSTAFTPNVVNAKTTVSAVVLVARPKGCRNRSAGLQQHEGKAGLG